MPYSLEEIKQWIANILKQLESSSEVQPHLESLLAVLSTVGAVMCLREEPASNANSIKLMLGFPSNATAKHADIRNLVKQSARHWKMDLIEIGNTKAHWKLRQEPHLLHEALMPLWRFLDAQPQPAHADPILINMGCGPLLIPFFAPRVIAAYRHIHPEPQFEVKLVANLPDDLTKKVGNGELDLIVTSFENDYKGDKIDFFAEGLRMHLCVARRSRIDFGTHKSLNLDQFKEFVAGKRVVMLTRHRHPCLCPDAGIFPKSTRHESLGSWIEVIGMGLAGNDTCCVAYPQIFPPEDRARFRTIPLEGKEFPTLRLGVARHKRGDELRTKNEVLNGLYNTFKEKIHEAHDDENASHAANGYCAQLLRTAHVSHDTNDKAVWIHGQLLNRVVTADGYLRADHDFEIPWNRELKSLAITGHLATNDTGVHLTWRGYDDTVTWNASRESYVASFSADMKAFQRDRFVVGLWTGRASWYNASAADAGYFVLYGEQTPLSDHELTERLNGYLQSHDDLKRAPVIPSAKKRRS